MSNGYIYMEKVIKKSREQIYQGESPFAAGILVGNQFYLYGNMSRTKQNPNLHAEIVCINKFCEENDYHLLYGATIYSSCEPCLMCLHSIINAGIKKIVYGATIDDAISYNSGDDSIHIIDYLKKMKINVDVEGNVLREKAVDVFKECIKYRGEL